MKTLRMLMSFGVGEGTGALVGAGTHIIGSALMDVFFQPQPQTRLQTQPVRRLQRQS